MSVRNEDARLLMRDIARLASEANRKHFGILAKNRTTTIRVNVLLLVINTILTSALWSTLTQNVIDLWVKYLGLALSLVATVTSGLIVALDKRTQNELSLEAAKVYGSTVIEATKFRIIVDNPMLSTIEEEMLIRIYQGYNEAATKYGDTLAQLQSTSVWSSAT